MLHWNFSPFQVARGKEFPCHKMKTCTMETRTSLYSFSQREVVSNCYPNKDNWGPTLQQNTAFSQDVWKKKIHKVLVKCPLPKLIPNLLDEEGTHFPSPWARHFKFQTNIWMPVKTQLSIFYVEDTASPTHHADHSSLGFQQPRQANQWTTHGWNDTLVAYAFNQF